MRLDMAYALLPVLCCAPVCAAPVRPTISLDGEWRLTVPGKGTYEIRVPGSWQSKIPELKDYVGHATYAREASFPLFWKGKRVFIHFGAADYRAEVYVNDQEVGSHEGGYTPFELEITGHINFDQSNTIRVEVVDAGPGAPVDGIRFEEIPHGKQSWYGNASGLWQSAWIEARPAGYIDRIVVDPDIDRSTAAIRVEFAGAVEGKLRLSVDAPEGARAVPGVTLDLTPGQKETVYETEVPQEKLWSPESPALYGVKAEIVDGNEVVDSLETGFGMRKIEAKDGKIILNNKPVFLAGALDQDFYPITEYTVPSDEYLKDQFLKAKHLGLNLLRCHIKVPDPRYLDWADELGLLVWYEIPNWIDLTEHSKRRGRETLTEMLRRDHNHPSLVIVSIINEAWGVNVQDESHRRWMAEMYDYAKSLEPGRLVVDNSACGGNFHVKTDIEDFHAYFQIPDQAPQYDHWIEEFSKHPIWTFGGGAKRRGFEPLILSEYGNWGLPRLSNLKKCYGGEDPWWFGTSRRPSSDNTHPGGVEDRFREYHLDKAFGTMDGLADAFQDQEWLALKYQIEELRKRPSVVGYVITEFADLHWESNGLLDWCRNPKTFHDVMHTVQDQDVVFARVTPPSSPPDKGGGSGNFRSGDEVSFDVWVSHFSDRDLSECTVQWQVESTGLTGKRPVGSIAAADARQIGRIAIEAPDLDSPRRMRLRLSLLDVDGRPLVSNCEDFCVFPAKEPAIRSDVIVTDKLERDTARRIRDGARAVICFESLGQAPLLRDGLRVVDRGESGMWGGWCNSVTWLRESRAFAGAPVPKTTDFSFEKIIPNCVIGGIEPAYWENDVLSGMFVGWVQSHAAVVAQVRCGKGKAILTTFPLVSASKGDPMARFLLASLVDYVASDACRPALKNDLDVLDLDHTFVQTAPAGGAMWRYTTEPPKDGWEKPEFDDSRWPEGKSGFGTPGTPNAHIGTRWDTNDIWIRHSGELAGDVSEALLRLYHDEDCEVYINGTRVLSRTGYVTHYETHVLGPEAVAAFTKGRNVIALHCKQTVGGQFIDVGMQYSVK